MLYGQIPGLRDAAAQTPGAFLFGWRLLALDSTKLDVPDTAANATAFGRHHAWRGTSAWPQVRLVVLAECGTHAMCDVDLWPCNVDEGRAGRRLLRSVSSDTLVLWDRGFQRVAMMDAVTARGAAFLARLPATAQPVALQPLPTLQRTNHRHHVGVPYPSSAGTYNASYRHACYHTAMLRKALR